jgi:hypothetical protein
MTQIWVRSTEYLHYTVWDRNEAEPQNSVRQTDIGRTHSQNIRIVECQTDMGPIHRKVSDRQILDGPTHRTSILYNVRRIWDPSTGQCQTHRYWTDPLTEHPYCTTWDGYGTHSQDSVRQRDTGRTHSQNIRTLQCETNVGPIHGISRAFLVVRKPQGARNCCVRTQGWKRLKLPDEVTKDRKKYFTMSFTNIIAFIITILFIFRN